VSKLNRPGCGPVAWVQLSRPGAQKRNPDRARGRDDRNQPSSLQVVVLFASYSGQWGGAERLLVDFAGAVSGESAVASPEGPLARAARAAGLRVFPLHGFSLNVRATPADRALAPARLLGHALELRRLAANLDAELVIGWGMRSAIALSLPPRPQRALGFQHNDLLPGRWIGAVVRTGAARFELVTAPSRAVAADLDPRGRLTRRLQVISPGVDVDQFDGAAAPTRPPEVLVLGALTPWKRPELALEACAIARRSYPALRLRLVGSPLEGDGDALLGALRRRIFEPDLAGVVELAGAVEDPRSELARATCLLHCADAEPFGIAVLEALAAGRPAVVPDAAGPAEIVDDSCGLRYRPGDVSAAAAALLEVLSDPDRAAAMGAAGRARARQRFDGAAARRAYADAVHSVLAQRAGGAAAAGPARAAGASLALVTVTHNSASDLRALLRSAQRHLPGTRVIVVDCASSDDTLAVARACACAATVALEQNVGFGRGSNRGIQEVHEPVCALVNPDVELIDASLAALAAEALDPAQPDRLLAPLILSPDGSRQDTVHPRPATGADLMRAVVPPALVPGSELAPWGARAPRPVGWAVGCALVARTDTLRRLGPFDEGIFMYGEDLDLGLRASAAGVTTWFWPQARVIHRRAHSSAGAFGGEPFERLARGRSEVVERRLGRHRAALDDASQALTFASRIAAKRLLGRSAGRERRQLGALLRVRRADARA
jgi:N-acetylglucosaminyl-diphospho-decaprenol L-rhamnosyltransferase